ncbi:MarR family winged helix-turn-helix transcriptional regulator [Subtercola lobariae]|uniref:MarR family transcriptional regulator n=1 Tax=Subtercola lobariae TaxID=1588641 RepID=A0A917B3W7_9MICO|nr:MarR family transcriptional regulator [Subtercola lobariae]GGF18001.1 MarR family transcriptional regulator [Subtercola lobariae]
MTLEVNPSDELSRDPRAARRAANALKTDLRDLRVQLAMLNHRVGAQAELRDIDLDCLDLVSQHEPVGASALAKLAGLHPATLTGVIDRLERGGWIVRERDENDRRAVVLRTQPERNRDIYQLYSGMNGLIDEICADYTPEQLELIAGFLRRTTVAGVHATARLEEEGA